MSKTMFVGVDVLRITHMNECGGPKVSHRDAALGVGPRSSIPGRSVECFSQGILTESGHVHIHLQSTLKNYPILQISRWI